MKAFGIGKESFHLTGQFVIQRVHHSSMLHLPKVSANMIQSTFSFACVTAREWKKKMQGSFEHINLFGREGKETRS